MASSGPEKRIERKRFAGLQGWLVLILSAFLLLVIVSVCLTFWGLDTQRQDAQMINLAGRQRLLIQQISSLSLEYEQEREDHLATALKDAAAAFDSNMQALLHGGTVVDDSGRTLTLAPPGDPAVIAGLSALDTAWRSFRPQIDLLVHQVQGSSAFPAQTIVRSVSPLVALADRMVHAYEDDSAAKINRLRKIQLGFLVSGLILLCLSWIAVRFQVIEPLGRLDAAARQIGEGNLDPPVSVRGSAEIRFLGSTMENMRAQLLDSRSALKHSIDTLETRVQQRTRELEAVAAVSQEIISHLSLSEVLNSITEKARQLMGSEVALLCLLEAPEKVLKLQSAAGPELAVLKDSTPVREKAAAQVLGSKNAIPCGTSTCPRFCEILNPVYAGSHLAAPLKAGGQAIGALCVGSARPGLIRSESNQVLTQLASVAAVALENSRLYGQVEHVAALEERQRIASDMHDGLLQTLSFLRWMVRMSGDELAQGDVQKAMETYAQIERAEEQAETEIRRAIASLQEDFPLRNTLQEQIAGLVEERCAAGTPVLWQNCVNMPAALTRQESEQVLRVLKEALLNAQNHSRAGQIVVQLEKEAGEWRLSITDDGIGFSAGVDPADGRAHFGLKIMCARATRLNGRVEIDSAPGQGTRVVLHWPEYVPISITGGRKNG